MSGTFQRFEAVPICENGHYQRGFPAGNGHRCGLCLGVLTTFAVILTPGDTP